MTILVAIKHSDGGVQIGSDTTVSWNGKRDPFGSKWVRCGRWHIGVTGGMRATSSLLLATEAIGKAEHLQALANAIRKALVDDGWTPTKDPEDAGHAPNYKANFLVTDGRLIGEIAGGGCVTTCEHYAVLGSGADIALGYLECAERSACYPNNPAGLANDVIRACTRHREDCGGEPWIDFVHPTGERQDWGMAEPQERRKPLRDGWDNRHGWDGI